jgi:two-component system, chemotaxis family, chemotaxis protein CheY
MLSLSMLKILVIEDNLYSQATVVKFLQDAGITQIFTAHDGSSALKLMGQQPIDPIDIVICDLNMAPMDGWGFCAALRTMPPPKPAIFILTGDDDPQTLEKARFYDIAGLLAKPISRQRLIQRLQEFCA